MQVNKYDLNRNIPAHIKKEIAQSCGFGCVICASIPYEFEHIEPTFAEAHKHDQTKMALLCSNCHTKVTKGIISKSQVWHCRQNPKSIEIGYNKMGLLMNGDRVKFQIGNALFDGPDVPIAINDRPFFSFKRVENSDILNLNCLFYDRRGLKVAEIIDNEWLGYVDSVRIIQQSNRIEIKIGKELILSLTIAPPDTICIDYFNMHFEKTSLKIYPTTKDLLLFGGEVLLQIKKEKVWKYRCINLKDDGIELYEIDEKLPWDD